MMMNELLGRKATCWLTYLMLCGIVCGGWMEVSVALPARCPDPMTLRSPQVAASFDLAKMPGFYYELATKDATQPRMCKCQTTNKTVVWDQNRLHDNFSIECSNHVFFSDLWFDILPDQPGIFNGKWKGIPLLNQVTFPDTVVDVFVDENGDYAAVLEFQCIEGEDAALFYAFNYYSRTYHNAADLIPIMDKAARSRGLAEFLDEGRPLHVVDHSDCLYGHDQETVSAYKSPRERLFRLSA
jgi:hypothetical protein